MEALEDLDDTQKVYANFDIPEEEMDRLSQWFLWTCSAAPASVRFVVNLPSFKI